ncbi:DNA glycosylase superfamily protein isoform 2 [Hibiscus syriacus]|uniref:DNA glycosylase superfamily protein isoform 2 n=1 Tax=Hibiscus syriacus TaxID=106335 RepID=A0A6A2XCQ8_HIBSY|nr:DNA glycosylase superfamily protein isoform 2 [Hibiscus syriacus]
MVFSNMSRANVRKHVVEKKEKEKQTQSHQVSSKNLKKIYPIGLRRSSSSFSLSSLSLSLSQDSNDSSMTDHSSSTTPLEQKIKLALSSIVPHHERRAFVPVIKSVRQHRQPRQQQQEPGNGELRRCNWVTKNSDEVYISFHDQQWGVPVYDDKQLFELLMLSGMLTDYNWTEILKRKEIYREAFCGFDPEIVAKMGDKEIDEISSNKEIMLTESRIMKEQGSFSYFIWGYVNYRPTINKYKYPRNVPLRTPKAEAISRDLLKRGLRFVGPAIVYSFMQAAGLTIDHLVDCFRYSQCVALAERPWQHI